MTYTSDQDPSRYTASRLDLFMTGFSFITHSKPEDGKTIPVLGFRIVPNTNCTIEENIKNCINNFPYFILSRVFPYFQFYRENEVHDKVVLTIIYFDLAVEYTVDLVAMQMDCPCSALDFKEVLPTIKRVGEILYLDEGATEICLNQPVNPRSAFESIL